MKKVNSKGYFFAALFLGLVGGVAQAGPIRGLVDCLNDEDCLGAERKCFRNITLHEGKCVCNEGYKQAKEDPIKCLSIEENECHTNLDCPHHIPCVNHFPILHTSFNRALDDQLYFALKKECMPPYDPTIGGFRHRSPDSLFDHPYYVNGHRLHSNLAKFHPEYIKFVEDAMLVLFLLCVLITLLVVHRASCYRQIRQARRNGPLRYIIPHPDDLPPPYSHYGPASMTLNQNENADGHQDDLDAAGNRESNKTRTETPPPSYDEALAISTMISQQNPLDPLYVNLSPSPPPPPPPILASSHEDTDNIQPMVDGAGALVMTPPALSASADETNARRETARATAAAPPVAISSGQLSRPSTFVVTSLESSADPNNTTMNV